MISFKTINWFLSFFLSGSKHSKEARLEVNSREPFAKDLPRESEEHHGLQAFDSQMSPERTNNKGTKLANYSFLPILLK